MWASTAIKWSKLQPQSVCYHISMGLFTMLANLKNVGKETENYIEHEEEDSSETRPVDIVVSD